MYKVEYLKETDQVAIVHVKRNKTMYGIGIQDNIESFYGPISLATIELHKERMDLLLKVFRDAIKRQNEWLADPNRGYV